MKMFDTFQLRTLCLTVILIRAGLEMDPVALWNLSGMVLRSAAWVTCDPGHHHGNPQGHLHPLLRGGGGRGGPLLLPPGLPSDGGADAGVRAGRRVARRHHPLPHQHRGEVSSQYIAPSSYRIIYHDNTTLYLLYLLHYFFNIYKKHQLSII